MAGHNAPNSDAERIRTTAYLFCQAFLAGASPYYNLDRYFSSNPKIIEHGPAWANQRLPFLGIEFKGRRSSGSPNTSTSTKTCDDYYDLLTSTLTYRPDKTALPPKEDFMVDSERKAVTVKLRARFASLKTGLAWHEEFVYVLSEFDQDYKIGRQELWADPLSAWMAVSGENQGGRFETRRANTSSAF